MLLDRMHPEDVKAVIRKRFGTIAAFQQRKGLNSTAVSDIFRGRTSKRVRDAIEAVLAESVESIKLDDSQREGAAHRLNAGAR